MAFDLLQPLQMLHTVISVVEQDAAKLAGNLPKDSVEQADGSIALPPVRGHYHNFNYSIRSFLATTEPDTSKDMPLTVSGLLGVLINFATTGAADVTHTFYKSGLKIVVELASHAV